MARVALLAVAFFAMGATARAQSPSTQISTQQLNLLPQNPVPSPTNVTIYPLIAGSTTYNYWIVVHVGSETGAPQGPYQSIGTAPLGGQNTGVYFAWRPVAGATSYDVLRSNTSTATPTGACGCAVATGIVNTVMTDNLSATTAYTVSTSADQIPTVLTNTNAGGGVPSQQVTPDPINIGVENSNMNNNGGDMMFPALAQFTVNDVAGVQSMFVKTTLTSTHISTATNTQIYSSVGTGGGELFNVVINTTAAGAITLVDTTAANCTGGTTIGVLPTSANVGTYNYDVPLLNGLCITTAAASDITISSTSRVTAVCLSYIGVTRQTPPRFTGAAEYITNLSGNPVFGGSGIVNGTAVSGISFDPNNIAVGGNSSEDQMWSGILKTAQPTASAPISYSVPLGFTINPGDWLVVHQDCANGSGQTVDAELQLELYGTAGAMPSTTQWFSDTFTRANENPVSNGGWWTNVSGWAAAQVVGNKLEGATASSTTGYIFNVASGTSNFSQPQNASGAQNQYADITIATSGPTCPSTCNIAVGLRMLSTTKTGYFIDVTGQAGNGATWSIFKDVSGTITTLTSGTGNIPVGAVLRGEVQGSTITAKVCNTGGASPSGCVTLGSTSDSSLTTGSVGFYLTPSTILSDNQASAWDAGSINN